MAPGGALAFIPAMVLYDANLGDKAKLVYAEIARLLGPDGFCWAKDQYLADVCQCSPRTVSRAIHDLAAAGYIQVDHSANAKGSERHIFIGQIAPRGGIDKNGETPQGIDKNGETPIAKNGETPPVTHYKRNNNNTDIRARARARKLPEAVDAVFKEFVGGDDELYARILDLAEVRQKKRKPYTTARQAHILTSRLAKYSGGNRAVMVSILDTAVEHGWETVYEPRGGAPAAPAPAGTVQEAPDVETWEG